MSLADAQAVIEAWRVDYNHRRPTAIFTAPSHSVFLALRVGPVAGQGH